MVYAMVCYGVWGVTFLLTLCAVGARRGGTAHPLPRLARLQPGRPPYACAASPVLITNTGVCDIQCIFCTRHECMDERQWVTDQIINSFTYYCQTLSIANPFINLIRKAEYLLTVMRHETSNTGAEAYVLKQDMRILVIYVCVCIVYSHLSIAIYSKFGATRLSSLTQLEKFIDLFRCMVQQQLLLCDGFSLSVICRVWVDRL